MIIVQKSARSIADPGYGNIGDVGTAGYGVGVCTQLDEAEAKYKIKPLPGHDDPNSDNYGNYVHEPTNSIMCWIPAFKYKIVEGNAERTNEILIYGMNQVGTAQDSVTHRAFYDDGKLKKGFFVDKYICSIDPKTNKAVSVKNGSVCTLTGNKRYGNCSGNIEGCQGNLGDCITLCRARGDRFEPFQCLNIYQLGALRLLTLALAQHSNKQSVNAWYDEQPKMPDDVPEKDHDRWRNNRANQRHNLPRYAGGSHRDPFRNDARWAIDPNHKARSLTGSCDPFAKCTHNGQNCGVADLTGIVYQTAIGYMGQGRFFSNHHKIADYDVQKMYKTDDKDKSHYRKFDLPFKGWQGWDPKQPMFNNYRNVDDMAFNTAGFINTLSKVGDKHTEGLFDHQYQYILDQPDTMVYYGCNELHGQYYRTGLMYCDTYFKYTDPADWVGFRASMYLES